MEISTELPLQTLTSVFEEKNSSNASYRLHKSQSKVSQQIKLQGTTWLQTFDVPRIHLN